MIALLLGLACVAHAHAEVILQYFNTSWNEIAMRMPELAEAGYTALWLPPPFIPGLFGFSWIRHVQSFRLRHVRRHPLRHGQRFVECRDPGPPLWDSGLL